MPPARSRAWRGRRTHRGQVASLATGSAEIITNAVLVILFVMVTSRLSSHAVARAAHGCVSEDRKKPDAAR